MKNCKKVRLGDICEIIGGGTPDTSNIEYWNGNIPWCTPTDITKSSKYISSTERTITEKGLNNSSAVLLPAGSILMCSRATIGPRAINTVPMATNQGFKALIINETTNIDFIYYIIDIYIKKFIALSNGSTFLELSKSDLYNFKILLPPIKEQEKIAEILSTQDKLIELKQKLIDQKKQQKKWLMQNLLTGRIRLKGFEGEWEKVRLGDYIVEYTEKTTVNNQYPILTSSRKGLFLQSDYYNKQVASENNIGYNIVPYGYFTYRHMSDDEIFKFNINTIVEKGIVSTLYPVFTTKNIIDKWLLYNLNYGSEFSKYARIQKQGGSRTYMYLEKLKKMKFALPPIEEQTAIAEIFSAQDKEIELLEKQLEQEKLKKKALMQFLLKEE